MAAPVAIHATRVPADAGSLRIVDELEAAGLLTTDHAVVRGGRLHLELTADAIDELRRLRVDVEVGGDVREAALRVRHGARTPMRLLDRHLSGFVDGYLDAAAIHARFAALHAEFPALTEYRDLPFATHGYDGACAALAGPSAVKLFRITTSPASRARPGVLIIAGAHGREWIPPLAAIELAEQLLRNHGASERIHALVEGLDWLIVPALNPDGINYAHHDDPVWRKNRRPPPPGSAGSGVDPDRNFGVAWGQAAAPPGSGDEATYRGPSAFSEPESRNVRALVEQFPAVLTALDCHSRGERFLRPQPGGGDGGASLSAADHAVYLGLEAAMNAGIAEVSPGKVFASASNRSRAGTCDEYLFFGHRIFAFELECGQEFQPPIAEAQVAALEVAAAALALGERTLALAAELGPPAAMVQVLDRSASMVAAGCAEAIAAGARRLIDLGAPGDRAEVVTFGDGGWTSIGGGLAAGAALLEGGGCLVLVSDGHENRPPMVAAVLPALPAGVKVHTVALGAAADQQLLQDLAAATGGNYYFSPDDRALPEIGNFVRADATDDQLVHNETVAIDGTDDDEAATHRILIDAHAASAIFCVTLAGTTGEPEVSLVPPGRSHALLPRPLRRDGHWILRVRRPEAGTWRLRVQAPRTGGAVCNVAAFVRSSLRLTLPELSSQIPLDTLFELEPRVFDGEQAIRPLRATLSVLAPTASLTQLARTATRPALGSAVRPRPLAERPDRVDALPAPVHDALAIRHAMRRRRGTDPIAHRLLPGPFVPPAPVPGGSYNLRYVVRGSSPRTGPFARVGLRCVCVDDG